MIPYGDRDVGQHWLRQWLVAWRHQAITWNNVEWSPVKSSDVHIRAISQEMPQPSITKICLKITSKISFKFPRDQWVNVILLKEGWLTIPCPFNTLRLRQNGRHFADDMFKCIFLNENVWIPIEISLTFVPKGSINNNPALFQIMAWRRPGDKPLSEPMMVSSLTHICVTRPQWVKWTRLLSLA